MKNLEIEYKQQIANEVPDLWSRIEAGINAVDANREKNNNVVSIEQAKPKKKANIFKYSAIIGAAACALIVVVAMVNNGKKMYDAAPASASEAPSYYASASAASEATCEAAEETCEAAAPAAEEDYDGAMSFAASDSAESKKAATNAVKADDVATESEEAAAVTEEAVAEEGVSETVLSGKLVDSVLIRTYMIITVEINGKEEYIFVPEDKIDEVGALEINETYVFTLYEYSDDKPQEISNNDDVTYEYISVN